MTRWIVLAAVLCPALAAARPHLATVPHAPQPPEKQLRLDGQHTLWLNNCETGGGCLVVPGTDDAQNNKSSIATKAANMQPFPWADGEWESVLECVQQVYSPYGVVVTDQRPTSEFNEAIVGGTGADIGYDDPGAGGVAFVALDCTPFSNFITYIFANSSDAGVGVFGQEDCGGNCQPTIQNDIYGACWVIAQESAHLYGLDHEFAFEDGRSACDDPMTYLDDCGGQKFFRNESASCGEFGPARPGCGPTNSCATTQNSHQKLLSVLGPGTPTTTPPMATILIPHMGDTAMKGQVVQTKASAQRGVTKLQLFLNGFKWAETVGAPAGFGGQPETVYPMTFPDTVPDGVIDIQVKSFDDLGAEGDSTVVRVTKGAPCTDATSCAKGQQCDDQGRCFWDAPVGKDGDSCSYNEFCTSLVCAGPSDDKAICTETCTLGVSGACANPTDDCISSSSGGTDGVCFPASSGGGCCSAGGGGLGALAAQGSVAFGVLAVMMRRRRARA